MSEPSQRDREIFAQKLRMNGLPGLAKMVELGRDNSLGGAAGIEAIAAARAEGDQAGYERGWREAIEECIASAHNAIEQCSEEAHNDWMSEKLRLGVVSWPNHQGIEQMVPWSDLSEPIREFDRVVVCATVKRIVAIFRALAEPATQQASQWQKNGEAGNDRAALHIARDTITIVDALRALDQARAEDDGSYKDALANALADNDLLRGKIAELERVQPQPESEVMPPEPERRSSLDNATAPVMGADPPWFKEQAETIMHDAHEACGVYHTTAKGQIIRALHRAFEYGKRFASDQPPSSDRVMTALSVFLQRLGHYSTVVDPAGIEAMRAALIAAAKARSPGHEFNAMTQRCRHCGLHFYHLPALQMP